MSSEEEEEMDQKNMNVHVGNRQKSLMHLIKAVLCYNLTSLYFGYCMVYFNALPYSKIHQTFDVPFSEEVGQGMLSGCISLGALFGALGSQSIISRYSRRQCYFLANGVAFIAGLIVLIETFPTLIVGRIIQGICVGFFSTLTPIMVKQYTPIEYSGSFGAFLSPIIAFGFFIGYLFPYIFQNFTDFTFNEYWRYCFSFTLLTISLQSYLIWKYFVLQTPKYLLSKGRIDQAQMVISHIYQPEYVKQVLEQKMKDLQLAPSQFELYHQLQEKEEENQHKNHPISQNISHQQSTKMKVGQRYPSDIALAKLFAFSLQIFQQLSGINVIVIYGHQLAKQALPTLQQELPLIINGEKMVVAIIAVLLLNRFGRKAMMLKGIFIVFVSLLGLTFGYWIHSPQDHNIQIMILLFFTLYVVAFVLTMGPITWLNIPQIVQPPTVTSTTMANWSLAFFIIVVFPMVKDILGPYIFLFFTLNTLFFWFMARSVMVETKDKSECEIRQLYEEKRGFFYNIAHQIFPQNS